MQGRLCRTALPLAALVTLVLVFSGCKAGMKDKGKAAPAEDAEKKSVIAELVTGKDKPPELPPEAKEMVAREFAGMDVDVSAAETTEVYLYPDATKSSRRDAMVFKQPVFTVRTESGHVTVLKGENAVIDPVDKTVIFDKGATVDGPWDNKLFCDRLTWRYTKDSLEADEGFTLKNGHGITNGISCQTDIRFRQVRLD